ncbi:uncharacterized protein PAC_11785 [Phialocephala subalpina]|uniref:PARP catalytic domain-containing protein n=1 Tax=Phialocephala subalpina TaxID=576137 RepID=A0A1L7XA13_9HELO|nr:uncharacterized protein PAC_11785 [Phialocephala subalpina]
MAPASSSKAVGKTKKVHFESDDPPSFPEDFDLKSFPKLKVANLQSRLTKSKITYDAKALKPELQAMALLSVMDILGPKQKVDEGLLEKVTGWCKVLVSELHEEIEERGLVKGANKWRCIEVLIQDEVAEAEPKKKNAKASTAVQAKSKVAVEVKGKRKAAEVESEHELSAAKAKKAKAKDDDQNTATEPETAAEDETVDDTNTPFAHPTPAVMNLLISTIYADFASPKISIRDALPGFPCTNKKELLELLDTVQHFQDSEQTYLTDLLNTAETRAEKLLVWIASKYGAEFVAATGDLKIPGFQDSIKQFVIAKPRSDLQEPWNKHFTDDEKQSLLLFHGTGYPHLQSILRNGFYPSFDISRGVGVFVAEQPTMSSGYATVADKTDRKAYNEHTRHLSPPPGTRWKHDPYLDCRLLIGCEVTGEGRLQPAPYNTGPYAFHVITKLSSVIPRYIFLLDASTTSVPTKAVVEPVMMAAFERIRTGSLQADSLAVAPGNERRVPNFNAMNLILSLFFYSIISYRSLQNDQSETLQKVLKTSDRVPSFRSQGQLTHLLQTRSDPAHAILSGICGTMEDGIKFATKELKIPSASFVATALHRRFRKSMVVFHGTWLSNLSSIIRDGFFGSDNDRATDVSEIQIMTVIWGMYGDKMQWKNGTYNEYGLVIGCEATDDGKPLIVEPDEVEAVVILRLASVMPRCFFLIPNQACEFGVPGTAQIEEPMMKAFKSIRALIDSKATSEVPEPEIGHE